MVIDESLHTVAPKRVALLSDRFLEGFERGTDLLNRLLLDGLSDEFEVTLISTDIVEFRHDQSVFKRSKRLDASAHPPGRTVMKLRSWPLVSTLLYMAFHGIRRALRLVGVSPTRIGAVDAIRVLGSGPLAPGVLRELVAGRYDIIHVHGFPTSLSLLALVAASRQGSALVFTANFHFHNEEDAESAVLRRILCRSAVVIARTDPERRELVNRGAREASTLVIPSTVIVPAVMPDEAAVASFRLKVGISRSTFVVLSHPWSGKGGHLVLCAVQRLWERGIDVALMTIGDPDKTYTATRSRSRIPMGRVIDLGWVGLSLKWLAFRSSNAFALPTERDAFGLSFLDAWASGLPVVACAGTVQAELITDGETGLLAETCTVESIAEKIALLARSPVKAAELGRAGNRVLSTRFSPSRIVQLHEDAFRLAAAGRQPSKPNGSGGS